ncbi:hypothetical protein HO133_002918 [Letharia lupina]|uniref:Uncharacterized protein n=1 Tax=Letharia lupina TaxID=560253 RepID=A0A8H6CBF9_9LECA|nr:uncharacterized protein HO133_002918 [Letharia lupina]KAF6220485.1 hypothetical protein HO133_002918 [Letharia lupina]
MGPRHEPLQQEIIATLTLHFKYNDLTMSQPKAFDEISGIDAARQLIQLEILIGAWAEMTAHPNFVRKTHVRRTELDTAYFAKERLEKVGWGADTVTTGFASAESGWLCLLEIGHASCIAASGGSTPAASTDDRMRSTECATWWSHDDNTHHHHTNADVLHGNAHVPKLQSAAPN